MPLLADGRALRVCDAAAAHGRRLLLWQRLVPRLGLLAEGRLPVEGPAREAGGERSDAHGGGVVLPHQRVEKDSEHLVEHADHRVGRCGEEGLALEAGPRDAESKDTGGAQPAEAHSAPGHLSQQLQVLPEDADQQRRQQREGVGVEHRAPRRLDAEVGDEVLAVRQLKHEQPPPDEHPKVGGEAVGEEAVVGRDVAERAGDDDEHACARARRRQRSLVKGVVEDRHGQRRTRTKDDDCLHVRSHQHVHV
mmetsp:Transcript_49122/g.158726  ORF Transcript_49122/g.158726 Transcript_49122/m.158726 type:complete len:250 (-) Transcript_49122:316-1065(-)